MDNTEKLLQELTEANGVSGYENEVRAIMARELKKYSGEVQFDKLGSVMGIKKGKSPDPRVMIVGHMDEIGFMVKEITKEGYIKFLPLGGWWGHVALAQRMRVVTSKGPVIGVVGSKPPHMLVDDEKKKVLEIKDMFIDVGAQNKFDITKKLGIKVGDPIIPDSNFTIMGNKKMYLSKAFDNRVACAIVLDVMKNLKGQSHPNTVLGAASVQEEVGCRGAATLAHIGEPDVCIVCDTGIALDMPPDTFDKVERLGNGAAILIFDATMVPNQKLRDFVVNSAESKRIPHHLTCMERGGTDGSRIHISRMGVPSIVIGPPVRYIHSHNGILNRDDYDNTVKLITELVKRMDKKTVSSLTKD